MKATIRLAEKRDVPGILEIYVPFILVAYASGHVLSFLSSIFVEKYSIWSVGYPSKYLLGIKNKRYLDFKNSNWRDIAIRLIVAIALAPIAFLDWVYAFNRISQFVRQSTR